MITNISYSAENALNLLKSLFFYDRLYTR